MSRVSLVDYDGKYIAFEISRFGLSVNASDKIKQAIIEPDSKDTKNSLLAGTGSFESVIVVYLRNPIQIDNPDNTRVQMIVLAKKILERARHYLDQISAIDMSVACVDASDVIEDCLSELTSKEVSTKSGLW